MKKQYIIVGDNNYWYSTFEASNRDEIDEEIKYVRQLIGEFQEADCNELYVYEADLIKTSKL